MSRRRWIELAGATVLLAFTIGWVAASARTPQAGTTTTLRKPVDWAALNPAFAGATFVNDKAVCETCHGESMKVYAETKHAKALGARAPAASGDCESCHGPRSKHIEDPSIDLKLTNRPAAQSAVCQQCHEGGARMSWKAGVHQANDVSCSSCHTVMAAKSDRALLSRATAPETCYQCHTEMRVEMNKMSHHPVREGRMDCASCHNPHGSTAALLVKSTLNETCYSCHADKRGPFLWEHAPARESCATCHTPHGSNQRSLLTGRDAFLCLGCHSYGGHINLPRYNRVSNPYGGGCVNCHITTHGSNHPSGAKFTR